MYRSSCTSLLALIVVGLLTPAVWGEQNQGQKWAVLIGVNDYVSLRDLEYARKDMQALYLSLRSAGFEPRNIFVLTDGRPAKYQPTRANIDREIAGVLALAGLDDTVLVAFSGHGVHLRASRDDREGQSYLCPSDANLANAEKTLVSLPAVYDRLAKCRARQKLMLVDACRNDPRPGGERTAVTDSTKAFARSLEVPPEGIALLTSCRPDQTSMEDEKFGQGVFMHYVVEGLAGAADRSERGNKDGRVSLFEVYNYAELRTKRHVWDKWAKLQLPMLHLKGSGGDWDITLPRVKLPPKPGETISNTLGMKLAYIPAGEFLMGSPASEEDRSDTETQHRVRLTKGFYLGTHEVTQAEFQRVLGFNPSRYQRGGKGSEKVSGLDTSRFPVEEVSWYDAVEFCNKLSELERLAPCYRLTGIERSEDNGRGIKSATVSLLSSGTGYRLPTEAEWEYACRAGTTTPFHFGSVLNGREANSDGNYPYGTTTKGPYLERPAVVGSYVKNGWGLYDMHGNVWEWCQDWYDKEYYGGSPLVDPVGAAAGSDRVIRGGGWDNNARGCRSAFRNHYAPGSRGSGLGFRVAQVPAE